MDAESALTLPSQWAPYGGFLELTLGTVPGWRERLPAQRLSVTVDGIPVGERCIDRASVHAFYVPPHAFDSDAMRVILKHPDAARPVDLGVSGEGRKLAFFAVHAIRFLKLDQPVLEPESRGSADWLEIARIADSKVAIAAAEAAIGAPVGSVLTRFASIGENCEFGLFQRLCGTGTAGPAALSQARCSSP